MIKEDGYVVHLQLNRRVHSNSYSDPLINVAAALGQPRSKVLYTLESEPLYSISCIN